MKKNLTIAALSAPLILVLAIAGAIPAAAAPTAMGNSMPMPPPAMVLQQIHMVNLFEINAAKLAKQKANTTLVKRYADRLWRDHHVADSKATHLAKKLGFKLKSPARMKQMMMQKRQSSMGRGGRQSMQPMRKMRNMMQMTQQVMMKLKSASGSQFDHAYIMAMVKTHQKAIHMLEKIKAKKLDQPRVIGLIHKLLPILKQHLKLAQHLQARTAA